VIAQEDHPARLAEDPLTTCWRVRRHTLDRRCHRQMAAAPDLPTKIGYYHLGPLETR
jgi:hypothetical protein